MDVVVAVPGLGEAGSEIAADLVAAGAPVRGYDPRVGSRPGVLTCPSEGEAVRAAALVLSLNSAQDAMVGGSHRHARRRAREMSAATELLEDLGVTARITPVGRDLLAELAQRTEASGSSPGGAGG